MKVKSSSENNYASYFVVAFVDLLGTDAKNAEIKAQSEFPYEMLKKEVAKVKAFQSDFYGALSTITKNLEKSYQKHADNNLAFDASILGNKVGSNAFSDSVIFYASLNAKQEGQIPVKSCFIIMSALVYAQLLSLIRGNPFRGGIEIGRAALFNGNQILGPALSDAVKLERGAQFPRIVIGEGAREYIELFSQLPSNATGENYINKKFADLCGHLLCESDEILQFGKSEQISENRNLVLSLDVHSDYLVYVFGGKQKHLDLISKARDFADSQIQRFSSQKEYNEKLAVRYHELLNYLQGDRNE